MPPWWTLIAGALIGYSIGRWHAERTLPKQVREDVARAIESVVADWPDESHGHSPAADGQWIADFVRDGDIFG